MALDILNKEIEFENEFAKLYCEHLFDNTTDGYIQVIKLQSEGVKIYNNKREDIIDVINEVNGDKDVFVSPNTMYRKQRQVKNIRQFRALFQDLDIHKLGYGKAEVIYMIWILFYENKLPKPTMITDSGRGLHLYWRVKNAPFGALNTWQELQDYLYYQLKHLKSDKRATDSARVLRLPGTTNSRCDAYCEVIYIDNNLEYSMYDLRDKYLNFKPKTYQLKMQQTRKKDSKVISNRFFNSYSLHMERANDIETLCKLRNYDMTGYRNMAIHCYAYWKGIYIRDKYELESIVIELNNSFTEPLKDNEIQSILRCIDKVIDKFIAYEQGRRNGEDKRVSKGMRDKEGYWYKNETLIERLGITSEEQKYLKTIIDVDEKYRRNNHRRTPRNENGLTDKQQEIQDLKMQVIGLKQDGLSIRKISEKLGKSKGTIQNILKKI